MFHGAQLAIDTTLVGVSLRDAMACLVLGGSQRMEQLWQPPEDGRERTYPELTGQFGLAKLVVFAGEVGGRWSEKTQAFLRQLAKAKAS